MPVIQIYSRPPPRFYAETFVQNLLSVLISKFKIKILQIKVKVRIMRMRITTIIMIIISDDHIMPIIVIILQMLLVTDYYERGSLYDYLQITVLDVEAMTRFVIFFIMVIIFVMINIMIMIIASG